MEQNHQAFETKVAKAADILVLIDVGAARTDREISSYEKVRSKFQSGTKVKLLLQPEDLIHDDQSKLKLEVVDRKFRGTNFIYTLKTKNGEHLPVFVHSHHIHQHEKSEKFGIKSPIYIDHLVCF